VVIDEAKLATVRVNIPDGGVPDANMVIPHAPVSPSAGPH
jgi:hypothetical protein